MKVKQNLKVVFSAHAEVVPLRGHYFLKIGCILRARGGSSTQVIPMLIGDGYSPRTRR